MLHKISIVILGLVLLMTPAFAQPDLADQKEDVTASTAATKDGVKGLSWLEINTFSPAFTPVDDNFVKRLQATSKLKLRYLRRHAWMPSHLNFDPNLRAQWKKVIEECTKIISGK